MRGHGKGDENGQRRWDIPGRRREERKGVERGKGRRGEMREKREERRKKRMEGKTEV